ncbi:hypothetical protein C9439_02215 [archaeon SCG-AAA382B04]|nr:hypothetical protein C9439_02215 [archaeon SCG-AAA382B04]
MLSVIFNSIREYIETAVGTAFFLFSIYWGLPFFYGGLSITAETTIQSILISQPMDWWIWKLSSLVLGFFEWVFSNVNPFVVPKVLELIQIGGHI